VELDDEIFSLSSEQSCLKKPRECVTAIAERENMKEEEFPITVIYWVLYIEYVKCFTSGWGEPSSQVCLDQSSVERSIGSFDEQL
jgi:hypothetical protein